MIGRDSKADMDAYGLWSWAAGVLVAAVLVGAMFALAKGFA
jgi:tetrahydromethanopterin S-methyltransferase subunit F